MRKHIAADPGVKPALGEPYLHKVNQYYVLYGSAFKMCCRSTWDGLFATVNTDSIFQRSMT